MRKLITLLLLLPFYVFAQQGPIKLKQADTSSVGFATQAKISTLLTKAQVVAAYSPVAGSSSIVTVGTLAAGSIPYSLLTGTPTVPTAGNPSGLLTFTAANGSGANFLRNDGLHAIDSAVVRSVANSYTLSALQTKFNLYPLKTTTVAGFALSGNVTLATETYGTGLISGTYNGSAAATAKVDTVVVQTVLNFFPKGDTRYAKTSTNGAGANPTATAGSSAVNGSAVTFMRSDAAPKVDSAVFRTVANSQTLAQTQTALNLKANLTSPTFITGVTSPVFFGSGSQPFVSSGTATSSDFVAMGTGAAGQTLAALMFDGAASVRSRIYERGASTATLVAADSYTGHAIGEQAVTTAGSGTSALITAFAVRAPLLTVTAGSTVTDYSAMFSQVGTSGASNTWNGWFKYGVTRVSGFQADSISSFQHIKGNTSAPSIAAGTGAGTSPTVTVSPGTDIAGKLNITTGTSPAGSNAIVATITFNTAYAVAPHVVLTPGNRAAQALTGATAVLVPEVGQTNGVTTTTFVIESGATNLTASTAYIWTYHVIQ